MRLRLELFVDDLDRSSTFYVEALGFTVDRCEDSYRQLRAGSVVLGLGLAAQLPMHDDSGGFAQDQLTQRRGAGVEIVLEVPDLDAAWRQASTAGASVVEPIRDRPWGQPDFRVVDPDGYYWRIAQQEDGG